MPVELPPSDAELVQRMRGGDDSAYEELFRRHSGAVLRYARTCCRDRHTADDLTAEVFARTLQAVRRGAGPEQSVRAYLLTTVRHVAAAWTRTARREQLVEDFGAFAAQAARVSEPAGEGAVEPGADVRAMWEAEQSLAVRAFRSLPERWQAVLWHTTVEEESPREVAPLFGLTANATAVLASRAREGLRQAYLQAHVDQSLTAGGDCARYADRLGAYARGGLRKRAERGLRGHLQECAKCRLVAGELAQVNAGIPALLPIAVIGWFAAGYSLKAAGAVAGGAVGAAGGGSAAGGSAAGGAAAGGAAESGPAATTGGSAAAGGSATGGLTAEGTAVEGAAASGAAATTEGAAAEGVVPGGGAGGGTAAAGTAADGAARGAAVVGAGVSVKVGIAVTSALAMAAGLVWALSGGPGPVPEPEARPPAVRSVVPPVVEPPSDAPRPPSPGRKVPASAPGPTSGPGPASVPRPEPRPESAPKPPPASASAPATAPTPVPVPSQAAPAPSPAPASPLPPAPGPTPPTATKAPEPTPTPVPAPESATYRVGQLKYDVFGDRTGPELRFGGSGWVWRRHGLSVGGTSYGHGITVHPGSSVTVDLNRTCSVYQALVGIDDMSRGLGPVRFSVWADGVRLWRSPVVDGGDPAVPVRVGIAGRATVKLVTEPSRLAGAVALADWAEARITCGGG
ncbi:sigma-70 family RNA polymerase sigma factor [Streptomyces sp. TRM76323]|uniref:Sigma-70 family RNA polymerase sigma factor n=1 Tax=Streptomyces tamarix TaxID=3078565 RepID=A0ABU3QPE5_9ACTN|nr:sigma-70 family RNA polymerase sigma factor [Streptomyces tamarix]MDT9684349.1 sigma-70 family RNA polymerase sigma factor [Streptomyces tamarix]